MTTAAVPNANARGTFRPGSRTSSAMYDAAFQPEYVNITGINASSQPANATGWCSATRVVSPPPADSPSATKIISAATFNKASTLPTTRPGPTPREWTHASAQMAVSATSDWREMLSVTPDISGNANNGVPSAAAGINRPR